MTFPLSLLTEYVMHKSSLLICNAAVTINMGVTGQVALRNISNYFLQFLAQPTQSLGDILSNAAWMIGIGSLTTCIISSCSFK